MKSTFNYLGLLLLFGCASLIPLKVGDPADITLDYTPDRIARGEYLAENVMFCNHCHSDLNWDYYAGGMPPEDKLGGGGYHIVENKGLIGAFDMYAGNITPTVLADWTDGELVRALVEGLDREGKPLFPIMPYERYRQMNEEDLYSVVAYIRSLKPVPTLWPEKKVKRMFRMIERTFPKPYDPQPLPDIADPIAYGKYLATIGDCIMCHSTMTKTAKPIEGMYLAGGNPYPLHTGDMVYSSNITPDLETGIGEWSKEDFIDMFRSYSKPFELPEAKQRENTAMPWVAYSGMTDEDLGAIYEFIMSVPAVSNQVEKWPVKE